MAISFLPFIVQGTLHEYVLFLYLLLTTSSPSVSLNANILIHSKQINNLFSDCSFSGSEKCLELLCKCYGSQIVELKDTRKRRPLHIAAGHGHTECVKYLLEEGAKTELQDDEGRTPLIVAAQYGQSSIVGKGISFFALSSVTIDCV